MSGTQNGIQKSMENIQATEAMKQNTLQYLEAQRTKRKRCVFRQKPYAALRYAMAVICVCIFAGAGGYSVYSRPVSYISIDVNPSIELAVNRFDRVVGQCIECLKAVVCLNLFQHRIGMLRDHRHHQLRIPI